VNRYKLMFQDYVQALDAARMASEAWWRRLLDAEIARGGTVDQAEEAVRRRWPLGPTSHPRVLAVYRRFYFACESLNAELADAYARRTREAEERGEAGWGVEEPAGANTDDEDGWGEEEAQIDPPALLVDALFGRRDDLGEFMGHLVFAPIGEEDGRSV
jgi:hypothetical protein